MNKTLKKAMSSHSFMTLVYHVVRTYSATFRLRVENEKPWIQHVENGGTVLLCAWHQQFFPAIRYFRNYRKWAPALMISKSMDGDLIAGVASRTGWTIVRGSSSTSGKEALLEMIKTTRKCHVAGHILDGPQGPMGIVKPGIIKLAHGANAVIVPIICKTDNAWYFKSWDKFIVPKPFSKVRLIYGDMIRLEPIKNNQDFEKQRKDLQNTMRRYLVF